MQLKNLIKNHLQWLNLRGLAHAFIKPTQDILTNVYYFTAYATWLHGPYKRHPLYTKALQNNGVTVNGYELDVLIQDRRNKKAAKRFFKKLLRDLQYCPRVIITDKLKSYTAAKKEIMPKVKHRQHIYLNNRAENSHQATRNKERQVRKFKSPKQAQLLLFPMGQINNLFKTHRHKITAGSFRNIFLEAKKEWHRITLPLCA